MATSSLKPFITVSDFSLDTVTVGVTDRYRVQIENVNRSDRIEETLSDASKRLRDLELTVDDLEAWSDRDSRTLSFLSIFSSVPTRHLERIRSRPVVLIGCGGLGSRLALDLAALGVQHFVLIDPDCLDESNLARMFYFDSYSIGRPKVSLVAETISRINPAATVSSIKECSISWLSNNWSTLPENAFLFLTADGDDGAILSKIPATALREGCQIMVGGYWESSAIVGPIFSSSTIAPSQFFHQSNLRQRRSRDFIPPSIGANNSLISGLMQIEYLKTFSGHSVLEQFQYVLELHTMRLTRSRI
jgi:hypothetical protein